MIKTMRLKIIASRSPSMTMPNFMKIYQAVQKLFVGGTQTGGDGDIHTDKQTDGDLISLL
jgi:hypothetical protein